jgi:O-antigen/teichoic acid export membrane protein
MKLDRKLMRGSIILLVSFGIFNFLNFMFHFSMARLLTVAEFGVLSTLFSIIYILSGLSESIQVTITKYAANQEDDGKLKNMLKRALRKSFFVSGIIFGVYLVGAILIAYLTDISYFLVSLTGIIVFCTFLSPITRGVLQGKQKFKSLGFNVIVESSFKLGLAIVFVFIGWKVYGAILGVLLGAGISFAFSFFGLKDIMDSKEKRIESKELYAYGLPSFFIVLSVLIFFSIDVFIARIVFAPETAGTYALASVLAKTIFFGTSPISKAMFPISAEKNISEKKSEGILLSSLGLVFLMAVVALAMFYFFPEMLIKIFSGKVVYESTKILFYLGIGTTILSFANLILLYKLSIGRIRGYKYLVLFVMFEIFLLSYFSKSLFQFSIAYITASAAFLCGAIMLLGKDS